MAEETKQNIKEAVIEVLEPFAQSIQKDFQGVNNRLDNIDNRLTNVEFELKTVKDDVQVIKENSSELFTKLDEFISLYKKQEQELLVLGSQVRRLEDRVAKLELQRQ
ncbi:MAG: hypothetical protein V1684_01410 [bacterium]